MKIKFALATAAIIATAPAAFAESHGGMTGDAAAGEKAFRQCVSCHVVVNEAGETLAGKSAKTGPNLYGIAGGAMGSVEGFRYSKDLAALGAEGKTWDEASFGEFLKDPSAFIGGRSKMSFKLRKAEDAANIYAYLATLQ